MNQVDVPYREGYDVGVGLVMSTADPKSLAVEGQITGAGHATTPTGTGGDYEYSLIQTTEDLEDHLGISASASGGVGLFSASLRFKFSRDCKVHNDSICVLITGSRDSGFKQINEPVLTQRAAEVVQTGGQETFAERYGNAFVRGINSGGQFYGFVRIDCHSEETRQDISAEVSGSYGLFKLDVQADLNSREAKKDLSVDVRLHYEGGKVEIPPTKPEELPAAYHEWIQSVDATPKAYSMTVAGYEIAAGPPPPNPEDLAHQHDILTRCARLRAVATDYLNLVDYILDPKHTSEFKFSPSLDPTGLNKLRDGLALDLDIIHATASYAIDHPKEAVEPVDFAKTVREPKIPDYTMTTLPNDMPVHPGAPMISVPNFVGLSSKDAKKTAADLGVTVHWVFVGNFIQNARVEDKILKQEPESGILINRGATITLTAPNKLELVGRTNHPVQNRFPPFG